MKPTHYSAPPAAKIAAAMNCTLETATIARRLMKGEIRVTDNPAFPATNRWIASCYHPPRRIDKILSALNELLECFGVEAFNSRESRMHAIAEYLNTGDTYSTTILFRHDTGTFRLTSWGDFLEANEKRLGLGTF
jgi:hypothetical protein